jgi:predicted O-methyltransferase YrrM
MGREHLVTNDGVGGPVVRFAKRYVTAAAGALYAFTLGVGDARNRRLIQQLATQFGHRDGEPPRLPTVSIAGVTSASTLVTLPEPVAADGNVTLLELLVLARIVRERRPRALFEIGTFDGRTTLALAMNASDNATVCTLDLPPKTPTNRNIERAERAFVDKPQSGVRFLNTDVATKIHQLYGDSATFDFSQHAADFVFVDGSHAYEYVLNDSERALSLLKNRGGTIVWHDYGEWTGVTRALDKLAATDARFAGLQTIEHTTLAILTCR